MPIVLSVEIGMDPTAFELGPLSVEWYGLGYVVGIVIATYFSLRYARERGLNPDVVWDILPWALIAGFVGARLYFVVQNDPLERLQDPMRIIAVWDGGMAYFGAVFGASAVILFFRWFRRYPLLHVLDLAAMFALMGQPAGRIGNMINGDILGPPTDLPWGFVYTHPDSYAPALNTAYHPAGLYLFLSSLLLIALLYPIRNRLAAGWFVVTYLTAYSITQLIIFEWRTEPVYWGLQQTQWTSLAVLTVLAVAAIIMWRRGHHPWLPAEAALESKEAAATGSRRRMRQQKRRS